jgi:hypothetical protein
MIARDLNQKRMPSCQIVNGPDEFRGETNANRLGRTYD